MSISAPRLTRHQEAAAASRAETRRRLLRAAEEEFAERGYAGATVARIARRAGVTVPTLYLAWGSKRALLGAYMDSVLAGTSDTPYPLARPEMITTALAGTDHDPQEVLRHVSHLYRQIAERAALGWQLYRDGAASDAEIAADWHALQALRHETFTNLINHLPGPSIRAGLTRAAAVDTAWALASPDTYDMLVRTRGYTLDEYEAWVTANLTASLLDPGAVPEATGRVSKPKRRRPSS